MVINNKINNNLNNIMVKMSEVFYVGLYTSLIGFVLALARFAYKSKCSKINFCCINIERNTEGEIKEDILEIQKQNEKKEENSS